ncbi:hypothetical protein K8I85_14655 [bacterium]|nr:hypothetical protein [bacterium]
MSHVIPKRAVAVRIHLDTGEEVSGRVFLDFIDVIHRGEQTLLDKFNDDYPWFPMRRDDGGMHIVNRNRIVLVEPGEDLPPELVRKEGGGVFRCESVAVVFTDDRDELEGQIAMDLPDEFCRASDFLNFPQDFFPLETEDGPVLVAKRHVVALRVLEAPPAAPGLRDARVGGSG